MDLLVQLGVNSSLFIQLGLFLLVFAVLKYLLFAPYYAAFAERRKRTLGRTELAERYISEARELEGQYSVKAQQANDRFREIYDAARGKAVQEYDQLINEARTKGRAALENSRQNLQKQIVDAKAQLSKEVAGVSQLINRQLIGKDLDI